MKISVDKPLTRGQTCVAVVTGHDIQTFQAFGSVSFAGRKAPLAIIICETDRVTAFHVDGTHMPMNELRRLCESAPDAMKAMVEQACSNHQPLDTTGR